jgi:SAM-dependent methyltransferase
VRDQVLDVGCGPGWLSEFLARCGYWVTGIDVSEDMVKIASERIAAIDRPVAEGMEALAEFHAIPVGELPWKERFDAAILYDAMHHFDDEVETLRVIRRALVPGGRIFIHEGVRPAEGSEGERQLIAEMEEYGTLESPFDPEYLVAVLDKAGFTQVTRFAAVDELLDLSERARELERIQARMEHPPMNTVIAVNPVPFRASEDDREFAARIEAAGSWETSPDGQELILAITVTNTGRGFWPTGIGPSFPVGTVTLGPYLPGDQRTELPRVTLPRSLSSGESVDTEVRIPRTRVGGGRAVGVDLVREGISWFADSGSPPLVVPLPDKD